LNVLLQHIADNHGDPADINEVKREIHLLRKGVAKTISSTD